MKILVDIGHPGDLHFFKNILCGLEKAGHEAIVTTHKKDVTLELFELYGIEHITTSNNERFGFIGKWAIRDFEIFKIARKFNPDVLSGVVNPCVTHAATLLKKKSITFNHTEHDIFSALVTHPFTDTILTPSCFKKDLGRKQVRYNKLP